MKIKKKSWAIGFVVAFLAAFAVIYMRSVQHASEPNPGNEYL